MTDIPSWAVKGAKCVCIAAEWIGEDRAGPKMHEVCEVTDVEVEFGVCWLSLQGHSDWVRVSASRTIRATFQASCFRPLITRTQEQDIAEHFGHHLHQKLPERA